MNSRVKVFLFTAVILVPLVAAAQSSGGPRERSSFNWGWLFQKDDPAGAGGELEYDKIKDDLRGTGRKYLNSDTTPSTTTRTGNFTMS